MILFFWLFFQKYLHFWFFFTLSLSRTVHIRCIFITIMKIQRVVNDVGSYIILTWAFILNVPFRILSFFILDFLFEISERFWLLRISNQKLFVIHSHRVQIHFDFTVFFYLNLRVSKSLKNAFSLLIQLELSWIWFIDCSLNQWV